MEAVGRGGLWAMAFFALLLAAVAGGSAYAWTMEPDAEAQEAVRLRLDGGHHACHDLQEWALVEQASRGQRTQETYSRLRAYVAKGHCWVSRRGMVVEADTATGVEGMMRVRRPPEGPAAKGERPWWWIARGAEWPR